MLPFQNTPPGGGGGVGEGGRRRGRDDRRVIGHNGRGESFETRDTITEVQYVIIMKMIITTIMIVIALGAIRFFFFFFFYDLLTAPRTVSNTYAQVARALITCSMPCAM